MIHRVELVDVLIVTAIPEEYAAVLDAGRGDSAWTLRKGPMDLTVAFRELEAAGGGSLRIAVTQALGMGAANAVIASASLIKEYDVRCLAMCGVCAGRRGDVALGDVIVADRVWQYDTGKHKVEVADGKPVVKEEGDVEMYRLAPPNWKQEAERFEVDADAAWLKLRPRSRVERSPVSGRRSVAVQRDERVGVALLEELVAVVAIDQLAQLVGAEDDDEVVAAPTADELGRERLGEAAGGNEEPETAAAVAVVQLVEEQLELGDADGLRPVLALHEEAGALLDPEGVERFVADEDVDLLELVLDPRGGLLEAVDGVEDQDHQVLEQLALAVRLGLGLDGGPGLADLGFRLVRGHAREAEGAGGLDRGAELGDEERVEELVLLEIVVRAGLEGEGDGLGRGVAGDEDDARPGSPLHDLGDQVEARVGPVAPLELLIEQDRIPAGLVELGERGIPVACRLDEIALQAQLPLVEIEEVLLVVDDQDLPLPADG
jgi:nucleoside phosphorylase